MIEWLVPRVPRMISRACLSSKDLGEVCMEAYRTHPPWEAGR
jgi:hypothetical protein